MRCDNAFDRVCVCVKILNYFLSKIKCNLVLVQINNSSKLFIYLVFLFSLSANHCVSYVYIIMEYCSTSNIASAAVDKSSVCEGRVCRPFVFVSFQWLPMRLLLLLRLRW